MNVPSDYAPNRLRCATCTLPHLGVQITPGEELNPQICTSGVWMYEDMSWSASSSIIRMEAAHVVVHLIIIAPSQNTLCCRKQLETVCVCSFFMMYILPNSEISYRDENDAIENSALAAIMYLEGAVDRHTPKINVSGCGFYPPPRLAWNEEASAAEYPLLAFLS